MQVGDGIELEMDSVGLCNLHTLILYRSQRNTVDTLPPSEKIWINKGGVSTTTSNLKSKSK